MHQIPQFKKPRNSKFKPTPHEEIKQEIERRAEIFVRNRFKLKLYPKQRIEFIESIEKLYPGYFDIVTTFVNRFEAKLREPQPKVIYPKPRTTRRKYKQFDPYETEEVIDLDEIQARL